MRGAHGHLLAESTSSEANPANADGTYYYAASSAPVVDWAERARATAAERFRESLPDGESMAGYIFPVTRIDRKRRA